MVRSTAKAFELVLTLGTGLGIALAVDGQLRKIRDVGAEIFVRGKTYDQTIGEHSRSMDEEHWGELLVMAVDGFVREFGANTVHLAGGNARRVTPTLFSDAPYRVVINGNQAFDQGRRKALLQLSEVDRALREDAGQYPTRAIVDVEVRTVMHAA